MGRDFGKGPERSNTMSQCRVIIVEDDDLTRAALGITLQRGGKTVVAGEAANGMDGLRLISEHNPHVAIVDIGLPDIDGIEVTRRIKAQQLKGGNHTKILILTLRDHEDTVLAAFAAGADSYCMKDAAEHSLAEAIQATKEGFSWIDPAIAGIILQQAREHPKTADSSDETIQIQAADPEYHQLIEDYPLTERELEVLQLIVEGCSNAEIAEQLHIAVGTVKTHVRNILHKLYADDRTQAAVRALRAGLIQ